MNKKYFALFVGTFFSLAPNNKSSNPKTETSDIKSNNTSPTQRALTPPVQKIKVKQMFLPDLDCGAHSIKDASLGAELLKKEPNSPEAKSILKQMNSPTVYKKCFEKSPEKRAQWGDPQIERAIKTNNIKNVFCCVDTEALGPKIENTFGYFNRHLRVLKVLSAENFITGFVVSTGGNHAIAVALKKERGVVTKAISMESSNLYAVLTPAAKLFKKTWLSERETAGRVVQIANNKELARNLKLFYLGKRFIKVATKLSVVFQHVTKEKTFFPYTYALRSGKYSSIISPKLSMDFTKAFREYFENLFVKGNTVKFRNSYAMQKRKTSEPLSKTEFKDFFQESSDFWKDLKFTPEQIREIIALMGFS